MWLELQQQAQSLPIVGTEATLSAGLGIEIADGPLARIVGYLYHEEEYSAIWCSARFAAV